MAKKSPPKTPDDDLVKEQKLYLSFQLMKQKDYAQAEKVLNKGLDEVKQRGDTQLEGLYLSALGVLYKLKSEYKKSYKYYQQAERLLKDDDSIKIISALLLIEQFKQFETAIRKLDKVINTTKDPAILHHALAIQAMAYFKMNKLEKVQENFDKILEQDFATLRFAANLDFKMVELFVQKAVFLDKCEKYLDKALKLAKSRKEKVYVVVIENLIKGLKFFS